MRPNWRHRALAAAVAELKEKEKAKKKAVKTRKARREAKEKEKKRKVKLEKEAEETEEWFEQFRLMRRCYEHSWLHPKDVSVDAAFWSWANSEHLY